jgi:SAM-dependent methyltransferase
VILGEEILEHAGTGQARLARAWLPAARRLLEIGCSTGYLTGRFAGRVDRVVGLDINLPALRAARRRSPPVPVVCSDVERLPFADGAFDAVVMLEVLEHTRCDAAALAEVRRVLRVGGALILSTPHAGMFAFLDPYNVKRGVQLRFPRLSAAAARRVRFPSGQFTDNLERHRHYALGELAALLEPGFGIRAVYRGGLLLCPLAGGCASVVARISRSRRLLRALHALVRWDFARRFGRLSYNVMVLAEKREP